MEVETAFVLWIVAAFSPVVAQGNRIQVTPEADRPSLRVMLSETAELKCCYTINRDSVSHTWVKTVTTSNKTFLSSMVNMSDQRLTSQREDKSIRCVCLTIREVQLNDTGLYQCLLNHTDLKSSIFTHGTFLQIYEPIPKTLNISERAKNRLLIAEGILLVLCLLLPVGTLIRKNKKLHEMEKMKMKKEEENIYEGLNLDECCSAYDKIQSTQVQGLYQDVTNFTDEGDTEFEKP